MSKKELKKEIRKLKKKIKLMQNHFSYTSQRFKSYKRKSNIDYDPPKRCPKCFEIVDLHKDKCPCLKTKEEVDAEEAAAAYFYY